MRGLILEVLRVVNAAELGRRKREKKRAKDRTWGIVGASWSGGSGKESSVQNPGNVRYGSQGSHSAKKRGEPRSHYCWRAEDHGYQGPGAPSLPHFKFFLMLLVLVLGDSFLMFLPMNRHLTLLVQVSVLRKRRHFIPGMYTMSLFPTTYPV